MRVLCECNVDDVASCMWQALVTAAADPGAALLEVINTRTTFCSGAYAERLQVLGRPRRIVPNTSIITLRHRGQGESLVPPYSRESVSFLITLHVLS